MTVESDAKFEEKMALDLKNDMTNMVNFNANSGKLENLHFDVLLLSKVYGQVCFFFECTKIGKSTEQ